MKPKMKKWVSVTITSDKDYALSKLKAFKGITKDEAIDLSLDLLLQLPPDEIQARIDSKKKSEA